MTITSRYNQGRSEKFSPIYVTPKDSCGARRCTVSGSLGQRPPQTPPPMTPSAMYSSPYLLKQFSSHPAQPCGRALRKPPQPPTWHAPLDNEANKQLYERHRAAGHGWRASTALGTTNVAAAMRRSTLVLHRLPLTTSTWRRSRPNRRTTPRRARPDAQSTNCIMASPTRQVMRMRRSERIATSVASGKVG